MGRRTYYKDIRFEHYRTFCEVARLGSFAAAAVAVGLSRPTVWQQIDSLERDLGEKLFRRRRRGIDITDVGRILLELVQPPVTTMAALKDALLARVHEREQLLRVAGIPGTELLEAAIRYRKLFASARFTMFERRSFEVVQMVENGDCDLGFCFYVTSMPTAPLLHFEHVGDRPVMLLTSAGHPLARKKTLRLADLAGCPLSLPPRDNLWRQHVDSVFDRAGLRDSMNVVFESDSVESHEAFVARDLGVCIGLPSPRRPAAPGVRLRSLVSLFGAAVQYLVWKRGALVPNIRTFADIVKELLSAKS